MNITRLRLHALVAATLLVLSCASSSSPAVWAKDSAPKSTMTAKPKPVPATMTVAEATEAYERSLNYLVRSQRKSGAWAAAVPGLEAESSFSVETHYSWQYASHALAMMALQDAPDTKERRNAFDRGLRWMLHTRLPKRGNHWDTDNIWAGLYGTVALTRIAKDARFTKEGALNASTRKRLTKRGKELVDILLRNQSPEGGWAYYDDRPWSRRNMWATSFGTALVLPYLVKAQSLGWGVDDACIKRSQTYVEKCRLPQGAYAYDLTPTPRIRGGEHINRIKGSLARSQCCNWALHVMDSKKVTLERTRSALQSFFKHHRFLDVARLRPNPHEAYYANSGYFYCFGHYYAALAINLLPQSEREALHARLRPHVIKTLRKNGSTTDFTNAQYMLVASTAYSAMALGLGLPRPAKEIAPKTADSGPLESHQEESDAADPKDPGPGNGDDR